jgi:hypothetical protein
MCTDGYWSLEHCDDLLNSSQSALRLRHILVFRHGCALMDVEAQNIAMICYICRNPAPNTETFEQICHDQQIQNNHVTNKKMIN